MSKVKIISDLKSSKETHHFQGLALKRNNQIIYNDKNVQTKITIGNIITIERKADYYLKINLKKGINLKGTYITNYGNLNLSAQALTISKKTNHLETTYKLIINDTYVDTFTLNLKISLDT